MKSTILKRSSIIASTPGHGSSQNHCSYTQKHYNVIVGNHKTSGLSEAFPDEREIPGEKGHFLF
jgi:hypothetical protein